ncbi:MAG: HTH-type transcriptional repressor RspR [Chlamydiae bacterium]|nr:HTH-type transcriptional repressor RspR [Chlamydiota bacterium]
MEEKIQRTFVRDKAYLKLRNWILEGKLEPKSKLKDQELAKLLGVSRTPIREALLRLEDEGLVQTKANSSTQVCPIDFHNAFDLYSIVWTLEQLALKQAFDSVESSHIQAMTEANEKFLKHINARNRLEALNADNDFHSVYITLSQNNELAKIIAEVKGKLKRIDLYYFDKITNADLSYKEHKTIITALQQKKLELALGAIQDNWNNSFLRFKI